MSDLLVLLTWGGFALLSLGLIELLTRLAGRSD